jgi:hypothetical protein
MGLEFQPSVRYHSTQEDKLMTDPVTAWSTLILAIMSFVAVGISYWGIKRQTESFALSVSAELCLKLTDRFNSESMIKIRSLAAKALLEKSNSSAADEVFDFFETVGLYVRKNAVDKQIAHSMFFHWVNLYWRAGKETIIKNRERCAGIYSDFEHLYDTVLKSEMSVDQKSRDINPTDADLEAFLKQEMNSQ